MAPTPVLFSNIVITVTAKVNIGLLSLTMQFDLHGETGDGDWNLRLELHLGSTETQELETCEQSLFIF